MPNSPSRPEDALDTFSPFINGAILALYFTVTQVVTTNDKLCAAICILIAGGFFFYNYYLMGRPIFLKRSPGRYLGAAFLILNAVLLTWGTFSSDGLKPWIAIFVIQLLSVAMPVSLLSIYGTSFIKKSLLTIALFFIWFGIINLAASVLGYSKVEMTERETKYTSHFIAGGFRYQTPLYSSWQVSGMLRWAVPLTMAYLIFTKFKDKLFSICLTVFFYCRHGRHGFGGLSGGGLPIGRLGFVGLPVENSLARAGLRRFFCLYVCGPCFIWGD